MILRSPHAHARIRSINTSKATALPGVRAVATAADFSIMAKGGIDFAVLQGNARMIAENVLARALEEGTRERIGGVLMGPRSAALLAEIVMASR